MNDDAFTRKLKVPVIVAKGFIIVNINFINVTFNGIFVGACAGQTMCVTACLHGNELNGIPVVHKMVHDIDPQHLVGNLVAIPIVNGSSI
jgi:predicted deacylase